MRKKTLRSVMAAALALSLVSVMSISAFADEVGKVDTTVEDDTDIDVEKIFETWVNYPDASFGSAYNAGWSYDSDNKWLNTTENVGWTGFYNPDVDNLTTGCFEFDMMSTNFDPCGFTWGMITGGTPEDPEYSFYAYEECHFNGTAHWSIAYISSWHPAKDGSPHCGPLYHSTIDADDYSYTHEGTDADDIGYAEGEVLAYGTFDYDLYGVFHTVKIDVKDKETTVYINDEELTTVAADTQAGSFGPFATSNPSAYFTNLKMVSTNDVMLNPVFEYRNSDGNKVNEAEVGASISVADLSTFEGSEITKRTWTVTKDDELVYTGAEPYDKYTEAEGTYVTKLVIENAYGITSKEYEDTLTVKKPVEPESSTPSSDNTSSTPTSPKTADSRAALPVSLAAAVSVLGIAGAVLSKKRDEE